MVGTVLLAALTFGFVALIGPDWARFAPATCLATHCFCELPRAGSLVLQPANSWSSFAFVAVGLWAIAARRAPRSAFSGFASIWFGLTAIVIGIGSFLLHATLTLWGQFLDVFGMYLFSGFALSYALARWLGLGRVTVALAYAVVVGVATALLVAVPETRRWLFAVMLVGDIAVELTGARPRRPGVEVRWYGYAIALQFVAFAIWVLDLHGILCSAASLGQGHAAWHLLNAAAMACTYRYFLSERASSER